MSDLSFGQRLKEKREQAGLSQKQLAGRIRTKKATLAMYEKTGRYPRLLILVRITAELHVSADELLGMDHGKSVDLSGMDEEEIRYFGILVRALRSHILLQTE